MLMMLIVFVIFDFIYVRLDFHYVDEFMRNIYHRNEIIVHGWFFLNVGFRCLWMPYHGNTYFF